MPRYRGKRPPRARPRRCPGTAGTFLRVLADYRSQALKQLAHASIDQEGIIRTGRMKRSNVSTPFGFTVDVPPRQAAGPRSPARLFVRMAGRVARRALMCFTHCKCCCEIK